MTGICTVYYTKSHGKIWSQKMQPAIITVKKITDSQVILEDGTIEEYKPFVRIGQKLTAGKGFAVLIDGKVSKCERGIFNVFPKKSVALLQAEHYRKR